MTGQEVKLNEFDMDELDAKEAELCIALMERAVAHKHIAQRALQDANHNLEESARRQESFRSHVLDKYKADLAYYRIDGQHCVPMIQPQNPQEPLKE